MGLGPRRHRDRRPAVVDRGLVGSFSTTPCTATTTSTSSSAVRNDYIYGLGDDDRLFGGYRVDTIFGDGGRDYLAGGADTDRLHGGDGNDQLRGDFGADYPVGGAGADEMRGGPGQDTYFVDNIDDTVIEYAEDDDWDFVFTETTYVLTAGSHIETLSGFNSSTAALDLVGNEFDNYLTGTDGMNNLVGGLGKDFLTGQGGSDNFTWTSTAETSVAGEAADVVFEFQPGVDRLVVSPIDADDTIFGNQAFSFVGMMLPGSFTAPGQIAYFTADTDGDGADDQTYILLNTDSDAFQEATIHLQGAFTSMPARSCCKRLSVRPRRGRGVSDRPTLRCPHRRSLLVAKSRAAGKRGDSSTLS